MNLSTSHIKDQTFKKIAKRIVSEMKRLKVPGVSVGIWHKGKEYAEGFGVTSVEHPLPVTADTLFQTGSISKTFTGTILMKLAEDGKVDLDAPVKKYIEDFKVQDPDVTENVTIRHLLTHMGPGGTLEVAAATAAQFEGHQRMTELRIPLRLSVLELLPRHHRPRLQQVEEPELLRHSANVARISED